MGETDQGGGLVGLENFVTPFLPQNQIKFESFDQLETNFKLTRRKEKRTIINIVKSARVPLSPPPALSTTPRTAVPRARRLSVAVVRWQAPARARRTWRRTLRASRTKESRCRRRWYTPLDPRTLLQLREMRREMHGYCTSNTSAHACAAGQT